MILNNKESIQNLVEYVELFYHKLLKKAKLGDVYFSYYKSLRGYFKHSIVLTEIKEKNFSGSDYKIWERLLTKVKGSKMPSQSGGLFLRFKDFKDICSQRSFYYAKKKFVELELIIETPFKDYYILNPKYIIKLYNPAIEEESELSCSDSLPNK